MAKRGSEAQDLARLEYLAIPVILLYPVGFTALFIQFTRYFRLDFYTALYAASLVNRMVAIGLGASILFVGLIGSALLAGNVGQSLLQRKNEVQAEANQQRQRTLGHRTLLVVIRVGIASVLVLIAYVLFSRILAAGRLYGPSISGMEPIDRCLAGALRHQLNFWPDSLVPALILVGGAWIGGWLISASYQSQRQDTVDYRIWGLVRFLITGITQGWIWPGLMVAYFSGIVASLVLALTMPAFMPYMTYGSPLSCQTGGRSH